MKIEVYWHSRLRKFSVRHRGYVLTHQSRVCIKDPVGHISLSGYARKVRTGQKNVYATIRGEVVEDAAGIGDPMLVCLDGDRWLPTDRGSYAELIVRDGKPEVRFWK